LGGALIRAEVVMAKLSACCSLQTTTITHRLCDARVNQGGTSTSGCCRMSGGRS